MKQLEENGIRERLGQLGGWERKGESIRREYQFGDFAASMAFVNRIAALAEQADHHPDIDVRYDKVTLVLSTHSAGGLTAKDFDLAARIDGVAVAG